MRHRDLTVLLVVPVVVVLSVFVLGCSDDDEGGDGTAVAMGSNRLYTGGDQWVYNLTGTYHPAAGAALPIGPVEATLTYSTDTIETASKATPHTFDLSAQFSYGAVEEDFGHALAFTQDDDGVLTLVGIGLHPPDLPVGTLANPIAGLDFAGFSSATQWSGSSTVSGYTSFVADGEFQATETISVPAGRFVTNRVSGTYTLDDFPIELTTWLNAAVGSFVRMTEHWDEGGGAYMDLTYTLKSTNVSYD